MAADNAIPEVTVTEIEVLRIMLSGKRTIKTQVVVIAAANKVVIRVRIFFRV